MVDFAANTSMLFTEVPFLERFERAARAGFRYVECQFPYEVPAQTIKAALKETSLELVLFNLPAGDWSGGERGIACLPDRMMEFRDGVARAIEFARVLGVKKLNCLAGIAPPTGDFDTVRRTIVSNLRFASQELEAHGMDLMFEPVNTFDVPGFAVSTSAQALSILDEVGARNAYLQYDVYHMQRMEGDIAHRLQKLLPRIGHVQIADNPGRGEPGTGEINFAFLFRHLDRIGWHRAVGCEYKPTAGTEAGLGWLPHVSR